MHRISKRMPLCCAHDYYSNISQTKIQGAVYTISSNFLFTSDGFLEWENQLGKVYIFRVVYTLTESLDTYVLLVPRFPIHNLTIYSLHKGRRTIL